MATYDILITFDGTKFIYTYKDQYGHDQDGSTIPHGSAGQTIRWKLHWNRAASLEIDFNYSEHDPFTPPPPTLPFTASTDAWTDTGTFNGSHRTRHRYTVRAYDAHGTVLYAEDPKIMFDDGHGTTGGDDFTLQLFDESLTKLGTAAQSAFKGLISDLQATHGVNRDPNGLFFPGGITNIQVSVTAPLGITVNLTISGGDPVALFPPSVGTE